MAAHEVAAPEQPKQPERPQNPRERARRLYDCARHIEAQSASETVQAAAREIALLAMDLLVEERLTR